MTHPTVAEMYDCITAGGADGDLEKIVEAVFSRRRTLADRNFDTLKLDDRVIVNTTSIKPRYLNGAKAIVVEKRISKVVILFDDDINDPYGKWAGKRCVIGAAHLVKVEE